MLGITWTSANAHGICHSSTHLLLTVVRLVATAVKAIAGREYRRASDEAAGNVDDASIAKAVGSTSETIKSGGNHMGGGQAQGRVSASMQTGII